MRHLASALLAITLLAGAAAAAPFQSEIAGHWRSIHGGMDLRITSSGHWRFVSNGREIPSFEAEGDSAWTPDFVLDRVIEKHGAESKIGPPYMGLHLTYYPGHGWRGIWDWPPDYVLYTFRMFPADQFRGN